MDFSLQRVYDDCHHELCPSKRKSHVLNHTIARVLLFMLKVQQIMCPPESNSILISQQPVTVGNIVLTNACVTT